MKTILRLRPLKSKANLSKKKKTVFLMVKKRSPKVRFQPKNRIQQACVTKLGRNKSKKWLPNKNVSGRMKK